MHIYVSIVAHAHSIFGQVDSRKNYLAQTFRQRGEACSMCSSPGRGGEGVREGRRSRFYRSSAVLSIFVVLCRLSSFFVVFLSFFGWWPLLVTAAYFPSSFRGVHMFWVELLVPLNVRESTSLAYRCWFEKPVLYGLSVEKIDDVVGLL